MNFFSLPLSVALDSIIHQNYEKAANIRSRLLELLMRFERTTSSLPRMCSAD